MGTRIDQIAGLLSDSKIYDLSVEFFPGMARNLAHPPFMFSLLRRHADAKDPDMSSAACIFSMGGHTGTHVDALGHFAKEGRVFGYEQQDIRDNESATDGLKTASIDTTPPIFRRGLVLDIARLYQVPVLPGDHEIGPQDLDRAIQLHRVTVRSGDVVLIRTGWSQHLSNQVKYNSPSPGINEAGADWLTERKCSFVGSDTSTFEKIDITQKRVHVKLLAEHGIQIIEMLNLEEVARDRQYEFLFVALPLRIRGGTGSPIRPVAIC